MTYREKLKEAISDCGDGHYPELYDVVESADEEIAELKEDIKELNIKLQMAEAPKVFIPYHEL